MEFKAFPDIKRLDGLPMFITQKLHGTNAQVYIAEVLEATGFQPDAPFIEVDGKQYILKVGSRTRWITPENDNYGFASFIYTNAVEFIQKLGVGQHFGEWVGPGINSGEGLTEKQFVLFDHWKWPEERPLPPKTSVVPVLYKGGVDAAKIGEVMADLKANGSKLVPGFMGVEGVVVSIGGNRYKKVFTAEETKWKGLPNSRPKGPQAPTIDVSYTVQPIRLEKLLSRNEVYRTSYPSSLPDIVKDYIADLVKEDQIGEASLLDKPFNKALHNALYPFIKHCIETNTFEVIT
jgi:hypothetical protein